jgi:hypothetical protein
MRRFWIMLLAVSVALVIALPAGAVKPPKPTPAAPIAVSLDGGPMWVHEADDVISYSVTVENKTPADVTVDIVYEGEPVSITVLAKSAMTEKNLFDRRVTEGDIDDCLDNEICDLVAEVTVQYPDSDDVIAVAETSTLVDPVDECVFEVNGKPVVTKSGLCIWKPLSTGEWTLSAVPVPVPTRPTNLMMTMRDGVPGNWCALDVDTDAWGGVVQERWLPKSSTSIVLDVYLPENGECLLGGHGVCTEPDCYFAVGNPESFYLYTTFDGIITLTQH